MADTPNIQEILKQRFAELAPPVQKAIQSEDISKNLRALADTHKLHLDQWELLENEVLLALFGITPIDELQAHIKKEVGVSDEIAAVLAGDISKAVFEPIRQELERELEHPAAKVEEVSGVDAARESVLAERKRVAPEPELPAVQPATPPPPPPGSKIERGPASGAYKPGEPSAARTSIEDDPYREPPA